MSDGNQNTEIILVRIEGKLDRMNDRLARNERDFAALRSDFQAITARVQTLETKESERKGVGTALKAAWTVIGALGASGIILIARILTKGAI